MIKLPTVHQDRTRMEAPGLYAGLPARMDRVLGSAAVRALRSLLDPMGLTIEPTPILHKHLSQRHLRLIFPVTGGTIQLGTVVSIVCLYDCVTEATLYAHPMHAGPDVNPLLRHLDGPMASPKAQPGSDGDRATARLIAHKDALWRRFLRERESLGLREASQRWRKGYYWALTRLYFCTRCTFCRWGSPFLEGPDRDALPKPLTNDCPSSVCQPNEEHSAALAMIAASDIWEVEKSYVRRGGFEVCEHPRIVREVGGGFLQVIFPTNAALIQGGTPVAVSAVYSTLRRETVFAHCLAAGPEPEVPFLLGDAVLSLPKPGGDASSARTRYIAWRREAWSQFWLDELEHGIDVASERWLRSFWVALEGLFGGDRYGQTQQTSRADCRTSHQENSLAGGDQAATAHVATPDGRASTRYADIRHRSDARPAIPFETLQNNGMKCFAGHAAHRGFPELRAIELSTLMVNLGQRCNQSCRHCHVDAGPHRTEQMNRETVDLVIDVLRRHNIDTLDITGGAPEMNPHFRHLAGTASGLCRHVVDRCNLTILLEPGYEDLPEFFAEHGIEITASFPWYQAKNLERQRGRGVFERSVVALRTLNALGYGGSRTGRILNLVYNPVGTDLAPRQQDLERRFRHELRERFGIVFNRLFAMNNMPVNRFRDQLVKEGRLEAYMEQLVDAFNLATVDGLMCRHSLSVACDGRLFDCDFNQAAAWHVRGGLPNHIRDFDASVLRTRPIHTAAHCFGCAAGCGSSCSGALASTPRVGDSRRNGHGRKAVIAKTQSPRTTI